MPQMRSSLFAGAAGLASTSAALAQSRAFGPGVDGWAFSATTRRPGSIDGRATREVGGREDILAMRTDRKTHMSVEGEGRRGKWPGSTVDGPDEPRGVVEWRPPAEANGARPWVPMDPGVIDDIAAAGH